MVDAFLGKQYKLSSSDKFDDYMKAVGVSFVTRKVGDSVTPVFELQKEGDKYAIISNSTFKNTKTVFAPNVEFENDTPDGRKVKSLFTINGSTITEKQTDCASGKQNTIERTWSDQELKMVLKVDDIVCTRIYKPL